MTFEIDGYIRKTKNKNVHVECKRCKQLEIFRKVDKKKKFIQSVEVKRENALGNRQDFHCKKSKARNCNEINFIKLPTK